ncbi:MAG: hypothetical protein OZ935_07245 [Pseudomonadota bacterium]|nr:hypothetical protein [Pseudomonadota bacterium]
MGSPLMFGTLENNARYREEALLTRRERLSSRLKPGASIGMDGVFNMQGYYAKGGFVFSHRDLRFRTEIADSPTDLPASSRHIVPLADAPFEQILDYDRSCFPASRAKFLKAWISQSDALALGYLHDESMTEVFGCARMYLGTPPVLRHERIFGVTTFEFG